MRTPILAGKFDTPEGRGAITTDELADIVIDGLAQERFMISTHPWVLEKFAVKARDYDEYIATMRAGRAAELAKVATRREAADASDFVRYSPEIETFDPKLSEYMTRIIDFWENKVRESPTTEGTGRAVRGAHAKTIGVVRAEVEILGDAPAPYAQGIYAKPGRHDALIRFSSASNHLGPDALLGPVLGFAIKIFDVDGTKLVDDEPDATTFDYVLKNNPTFIANTAKHYLFIQEIGDQVGDYLARGKTGFHDLLNDYLTGKGTLEQEDWAWEELFAFVQDGDADTGAQSGAQHVLDDGGGTPRRLRRQGPGRSGRRQRRKGHPPATRPQQRAGRVRTDPGGGTASTRVRFRPSGSAVHGSHRDAGQRRDRGMAGEAVAFRHRRTGTSPAPGHLRIRRTARRVTPSPSTSGA